MADIEYVSKASIFSHKRWWFFYCKLWCVVLLLSIVMQFLEWKECSANPLLLFWRTQLNSTQSIFPQILTTTNWHLCLGLGWHTGVLIPAKIFLIQPLPLLTLLLMVWHSQLSLNHDFSPNSDHNWQTAMSGTGWCGFSLSFYFLAIAYTTPVGLTLIIFSIQIFVAMWNMITSAEVLNIKILMLICYIKWTI